MKNANLNFIKNEMKLHKIIYYKLHINKNKNSIQVWIGIWLNISLNFINKKNWNCI